MHFEWPFGFSRNVGYDGETSGPIQLTTHRIDYMMVSTMDAKMVL